MTRRGGGKEGKNSGASHLHGTRGEEAGPAEEKETDAGATRRQIVSPRQSAASQWNSWPLDKGWAS